MFAVVERLYSIQVRERVALNRRQSDVRFFDVFDVSAELRGQFYLNLYAQLRKHAGAWMDGRHSRPR
jgi:oligopeptidase A